MGDFNVLDMITRLPITEGDEVVAFCVPERMTDFLNLRCGLFNDINSIRMVRGVYGGYGDVVDGDCRLFEKDKGEVAFFVRKTTVDFIEKEYAERVVWEHEEKERAQTLSVDIRSCENNPFAKGMYEKYGHQAVDWAMTREYVRSGKGSWKSTILDAFDFSQDVKKGEEKILDESQFEEDAQLYLLLFQKIEWFCIGNRISPFMYNFERYSGQGIQYDDYDRARRFAKFIEGECDAKIEQYEKEMRELDEE